MQTQQADEIAVADAAVRLRISRERVIRLIQVGQLHGRRDAARGWLVSEDAVAKFARRRSGEE